ncbi:hypothetical protein [Nocardiopsis sp. MG754419]|uniref:hypothetical protein n=1 Tax=Nocardiopsis sp. MG754419 TaxID=2259865 RepID=UPI001BA51B07|nr:hypothetical protein [Nocardiopsis sp. MG754419]MBR8741117.1 hypothetical protein [Nocardiopsis sp. MG754419]
MTNDLWATDRIGALGSLLEHLDPGKWTEADLSRMAIDQGWKWEAGEWGPILRTGSFGDAWLRPADELMDRHVTREEYVGAHFPLGRVEGGTRAQVEAFRDAGRALRARLGEPNVVGSEDANISFHDRTPLWGAPFLRWRRHDHSVELRAGGDGPVLCLLPTSPVEGWFWYHREHGGDRTGGFLGVSLTGDIGGMSIAGVTHGEDWTDYARRLVEVFRHMPAELTALDLGRAFGFHGHIPGHGAPWVFHLELGEYAELGLDEAAVHALAQNPEAPAPEELGWIEATEERHRSADILYQAPRYRYDEVNAVRMAMLVLETVEALRIDSPRDLSLTDDGDRIPFPGGGGRRSDYQVSDYGLGLTGNP